MNQFLQKNWKWKNCQKRQRKMKSKELSYITPNFGKIGIKSCENFLITPDQLEMSRRIIVRTFSKKIKFWINIRCNTPLTKKPIGIRMGKGKGRLDKWVFPIKKGRIIFEFEETNFDILKKCFNSISKRLPGKLKIVRKYN